MESSTDNYDFTKNLIRKAEITRNAHFSLSYRYKKISKWLSFSTLIGASIVSILTFSDYDIFLDVIHISKSQYDLLTALLALFVFLMTLTEAFLNLKNKALLHEAPAKQLTTFIRNANVIKKKEVISENDLMQLTTEYGIINQFAPSIPDKIFYKAKQKLYIKIEISKALDRDPFFSIKKFKKGDLGRDDHQE